MRDVFDGAVITLECLGDVKNPDFKFLDAVTDAHAVKLSPSIDPPFTGTHWQCMENVDGTFVFASAGDRFGFRYLDGRTQDGFVQVVGDTLPPFTGTTWEVRELQPGVVTLRDMGAFDNPAHKFLDGDTRPGQGRVGLAPNTEEPFSGTKWGTRLLATPELRVTVERSQTTFDLKLRGLGFTAGSTVTVVAEGIVQLNHQVFTLDSNVRVGSDGSFSTTAVDIAHRPGQEDNLVTVRAYDTAGVTATAKTNAFTH